MEATLAGKKGDMKDKDPTDAPRVPGSSWAESFSSFSNLSATANQGHFFTSQFLVGSHHFTLNVLTPPLPPKLSCELYPEAVSSWW